MKHGARVFGGVILLSALAGLLYEGGRRDWLVDSGGLFFIGLALLVHAETGKWRRVVTIVLGVIGVAILTLKYARRLL